jgi:hypothetical protein
MSPFHYFLYITNALLSSFALSTDRLSRVIKRNEPKGSLPLAYFISAFLIISPIAPQYSKTQFNTTILVTTRGIKDRPVFNQPLRLRII